MKGAIRLYALFVIAIIIATVFFVVQPLTVVGSYSETEVIKDAEGREVFRVIGKLESTTYTIEQNDDVVLDRWEFTFDSRSTDISNWRTYLSYTVKWLVNGGIISETHSDTILIEGVTDTSSNFIQLVEYPNNVPNLGELWGGDRIEAVVVMDCMTTRYILGVPIPIVDRSFTLGGCFIDVIAEAGEPVGPDTQPEPIYNNPPIAEFSVNTQQFNSVPASLVCYGEATDPEDGVLPYTAYEWIWGDGTSTPDQINPRHTYRTAGNFAVTCIVTDSDGNTGQKTIGINVKVYTTDPITDPPPPTADLFGNVYDASNNIPIEDATVQLETGAIRNTNSDGYFIFEGLNQEELYFAEVYVSDYGNYILKNVGLVPEVQNDIYLEELLLVPEPTPDDTDGDGIPDNQDAFIEDPTEWTDTDNDGIGDNSDTDYDGDGIPNKYESITDLKFEWNIFSYLAIGITILLSIIIIVVPKSVIQQKGPLLIIIIPTGIVLTFLIGWLF